MRGLRPLVVVSLRRLLLGLAGAAGAALALTLALTARPGAADGAWGSGGGLAAVFAASPLTAPAPGFGSVTVVIVPAAAGRAALLLRDGLSAGRFGGGPLTVAVRAGDTLAIRGAAAGAAARVLAVAPGTLAPGPGSWPLGAAGATVLPVVRLAPPAGS